MIKNVQRALLTLLALVVPLVTGTANAEVTYFHHDALGSVVAATNESGTLLWRESYQPFGERLDKAVSTDQHAFYYTGKPHDDRTGLTYFGARHYDPVIGRFMGMDTVGVVPENVHTFNRYAYAANNPYKYVDPDGRFFFLLVPLAEYTFAMLAADVVFASTLAVATEHAVSGSRNGWEPESTWDGDYGSEVVWLPSDYFPDTGGGGDDDPNEPNKKDPKRQKSKKSEHTSNRQQSNKSRHQEGKARAKKDAQNEKADARRKSTNKGGPGGSRIRH